MSYENKSIILKGIEHNLHLHIMNIALKVNLSFYYIMTSQYIYLI